MLRILHLVDRAAARLAKILIRIYQCTISPLISAIQGPDGGCRHEPTCSRYAMECFGIHPFFKACQLTISRVFRCNPWGPGGYDPVPPPDRKA